SLEALTRLLSEKETVTGEEIEGIIAGEKAPARKRPQKGIAPGVIPAGKGTPSARGGTEQPEIAEIPGSNGRERP
ncbi:MAG: hypothetical protein ACOC25_05295, partial [Alkalispirochaetaceae bacterium]